MNRVKSKVAIVTGGALGIGRSACILLAQEGAVVALTDVLEDEGRKAAAEIEHAGGKARFWRLDVSRESEVQPIFGEIERELGGIDVLVNNAGISGVDKPTHRVVSWKQEGIAAPASACGARGRGRDSGYPLPPAQTRAGAANAHGSYLGCVAANRSSGQGCRVATSGMSGARRSSGSLLRTGTAHG